MTYAIASQHQNRFVHITLASTRYAEYQFQHITIIMLYN